MTVADRIGVMVSGTLTSLHDADATDIQQIIREMGGAVT